MARSRPGWLALARRVLVVLLVCVRTLTRLGVQRAGWRLRPATPRHRPEAGEVVAQMVEDLGPAFVKVAQILSTRADLLAAPTRAALGRLYDRVRPPPAEAVGAVPARVADAVVGGADGLVPVAAGSIASVYRARLRTGEAVAVKVLRPGVAHVLATDLALLEAAGRIAVRWRRFRRTPLVAALSQLSDVVYGQLDLVREGVDLTTLRRTLGDQLPGVRVPAVIARWSDSSVLVLEYVPDLTCQRTADPVAVRTAALVAMRACFHMIFIAGVVHCDMHPGNLYLGANGGCVLLDAGFCHHLPSDARRKFAEFFYGMARGEGDRCADIVLATATAGAGADPERFRRDLASLVEQNSGATVAEFDLGRFATRLFEIQHVRGLYADVQFVFPILALLVLEGTLRQACPDVSFQREAMPYVLRGMMT